MIDYRKYEFSNNMKIIKPMNYYEFYTMYCMFFLSLLVVHRTMQTYIQCDANTWSILDLLLNYSIYLYKSVVHTMAVRDLENIDWNHTGEHFGDISVDLCLKYPCVIVGIATRMVRESRFQLFLILSTISIFL